MKVVSKIIFLIFITFMLANCAANSATRMKQIVTKLDVKQK